MQNQTFRLFLYSSIAILVLTLVWGVRQVPKQSQLAEEALKNGLEQELILLSSAVKLRTEAMRYQLLDVLKAEGNDRVTRAFQDSAFVAAALFEWDGTGWKPAWQTSKSTAGLQADAIAGLGAKIPFSEMAPSEAYFEKVSDVNGQAYFAVAVPVKRPAATPLVGVGVFPAARFALNLSADTLREIKVFDDKGFALALSRPAYLGASLKRDPLTERMIGGLEVRVRHQWRNAAGQEVIGAATRAAGSNLMASVEAPLTLPGGLWLRAWLYLSLCAAGAVAVNWWLFNSLVKPMLEQISQADLAIEHFKKQLSELSSSSSAGAPNLVKAELDGFDFIETPAVVAVPANGEAKAEVKVALSKLVQGALRTHESRLKELGIQTQVSGIEGVEIHSEAIQLQTALEEVIKNSIEAMETSEQRWLGIHVNSEDGKIKMQIEDTGIGIEPIHLDKVFDPFFSTKDAQGVSRGLGLNVVRRVIEEMKGQVHVEIRENTTGTRVELSWPTEREPELKMAPELEMAPEPGANEEDDFEAMIMSAPLVPSSIAIRRPKVRSLD